MIAERIAQVLEEWYNAGHVNAGGQRLEYEDFLELTNLAKSAIAQQKFQEQELLGQTFNLGDLVTEHEIEITTDKYHRNVIRIPIDIMQLPGNSGIFSITPLASDGSLVTCKPFIRMDAGSEWLFCNDQNGPFTYFTLYKDTIVLYYLDDCVKKVLVYLVSNAADANIPDDIGWEIFKQVTAQVIRTYAIPVDKRADGNPNPDEIFKTKLTSPQLNR